MTRNYMTSSDIEYLENYRGWFRSSMEYTVFNAPPSKEDPVFLANDLPVWLSGRLQGSRFVTLGEMVMLCENSASNKLIYEAWVNSALEHAYSASSALNHDDGKRFIAFFKASHGIKDRNENDLASESSEAVSHAYQAIYGDIHLV